MSRKTMDIHGVCFEVEKSIDYRPIISEDLLNDCYERPSITKQRIWDYWRNWFICHCGSVDFGVRSHSCNFFTIEGVINLHGVEYYLVITKGHNRAYEIVRPECD